MTIIVSNLADGVTDADLLQLFESYGQVLDCEMCGKSAIVILKENAIQAKVELNDDNEKDIQKNSNNEKSESVVESQDLDDKSISSVEQNQGFINGLNKNISNFFKGMFTRKVQKELTINQYSTTNKLIAQILESDKSNQDEDDTIIKLNRIHLQIIEDEDTIKLGQIMGIESLSAMRKRMYQCKTNLEFALLDIIEYTAERSSEMELIQNKIKLVQQTTYYERFEKSGIVDLIRSLIREKVAYDQQKQKIPFSDLTLQLIRIYLLIMAGQDIENDLLEMIANVISSNIKFLIECINSNQKQEQEKHNQSESKLEKEINDEIQEFEERFNHFDNNDYICENKIVQLTKTLHALIKISSSNRKYLISISKLHEIIAQLVHFNCPSDINCPKLIKLNQSVASQELQAASINVIKSVAWMDQVKEYLNTEHNILPHLSNIIIMFANQSLCNKDQEESFVLISLNLVEASAYLLQILIYSISSYVSVIPSNQFLLQALVKLSKYKIGDIISHYSDNQPSSIRNNCRESLNRIQQYGDALAQNNISQAGYATSLVASFSSNIQFNKEYFVSDALFDLNSYFEEMLNGRYCIRIKIRFPRQPTIVKISLEQIEEEGGNEEIDFHIHNKGEGYFRNQQQIRKQARFTLEIILNAEQDQSNR